MEREQAGEKEGGGNMHTGLEEEESPTRGEDYLLLEEF